MKEEGEAGPSQVLPHKVKEEEESEDVVTAPDVGAEGAEDRLTEMPKEKGIFHFVILVT